MVAFASTRRASSRRGVGVAVQSVTKRRLALGPDDDARRRASAASPRSRPALVGGGARQRRTRARAPAHHPGRDSASVDVVHRGDAQGNAREHLRFTLVRQTRRPGTEEVRARRRPVGRPRGGTGRGARRQTRVARPRRGVGVRIHAAHVPPGDAAIAAGWRAVERRRDARRRRRRERRLGVERRGRHRHGNARGMRGTRRESVFGIVPVRAVTRGEKREKRVVSELFALRRAGDRDANRARRRDVRVRGARGVRRRGYSSAGIERRAVVTRDGSAVGRRARRFVRDAVPGTVQGNFAVRFGGGD